MDVSGVNEGYYVHAPSYSQQHEEVLSSVTSPNFAGIGMQPSGEHPAHSQSNQQLQQLGMSNSHLKNQLAQTPEIVPVSIQAIESNNRQKQQIMPPTPPGETPSADEKDIDEDRRRILLNMIPPNSMSSGQTPGPLVTSLTSMHHQYSNPMNMPGPPNVNAPQMMMMQSTQNSQANFQMPHPQTSTFSFSPHMVNMPEEQNHINDNLEDEILEVEESLSASAKKRRNNKCAVLDDDKDDRYFERRKRNNLAAKRSRDARKMREEQIGMRASFLEKENAMLHAQLTTLREEANALRQLLSQRTMMTSPHHQLGPGPQQGLPQH
ncbi:thyrotroph embryonic factor-like [Anneissia japonica]|uniref:thyrotroph embryonic factor-like n=1 Tax=Anneissia japonica TaxID=1529436 RepID=UPI0014254D86|nr:thyrotroph embryonic factor-like [Anneissia japonica]